MRIQQNCNITPKTASFNPQRKVLRLKPMSLNSLSVPNLQLPSMKQYKENEFMLTQQQQQQQVSSPSAIQMLDSEYLNFNEEKQQENDDQFDLAAQKIGPEDDEAFKLNNILYKKLDKVLEKKEFYQKKNFSMFTAMLQNTQYTQQKTLDKAINYYRQGVLPKNFGLIGGTSLSHDILNANNFSMGDRYAEVLAAGLNSQSLKDVSSISLKNNRLTSRGINEVTRVLSKKVDKLNLQGNSLGQHIHSELSFNNLLNLQELNLENNSFNDESARLFFTQIGENKRLRKLNFSQNKLGDSCRKELYNFIVSSRLLQELYLHWNCLHDASGKMIVLALIENQSLQVIDLSYNSLGIAVNNTSNGAEYLSEYLGSQDCRLVHLDLSHNYFNLDQAKSISEGLNKNHTMYGFHFQGNADNNCYIDSTGFLVFPKENSLTYNTENEFQYQQQYKYIPGILKHKRINSVQPLLTQKGSETSCWICDGWVELVIEWQPTCLDFNSEPVFVHFSHEGYAPILLTTNDSISMQSSTVKLSRQNTMTRRTNSNRKWSVKRMFPPGQSIKFFFSCPQTRQSAVSRHYKKIQWTKAEMNRRILFYTVGDEIVKFPRPTVANYLKVSEQQTILQANCYGIIYPLVECIPRMKESGVLNLDEVTIVKEVKQDDFFQDCPRENEEMVGEFFEFDWNKSAIPSLIKSKQDQIETKDFLRSVYIDIMSAYRYISSYSPCGDIQCISLNCYTDLFASLMVSNKYGLKDMDIVFKQCTSRNKYNVRPSTQLALIRFSFLEIIIRLAMDKYYRTSICSTVIESLQQVYDSDNLNIKIESFEQPQVWRDQVYWNLENNKFINEYLSVFQSLYDKSLQYRVLSYFTTAKFLTPASFKQIFVEAQLINDSNVERNINISFSLSVFPIKDEVTSDRQMQMNFHEFVEALFRIADKLTIPITQDEVEQETSNLALKIKYLVEILAKKFDIMLPQEKKKIQQNRILKNQAKQGSFLLQQPKFNDVDRIYEIEASPIEKQNHNDVPLNFSEAIQNI